MEIIWADSNPERITNCFLYPKESKREAAPLVFFLSKKDTHG